jgi:hypothetical protein
MKREFPRKVFEKYSNVKCHENPASGNRVIPCGKTDKRTDRRTNRYEEANSHFSQFRERAQKTTITTITTSVPILVNPRVCNHTTLYLPLRLGIPKIRIAY